MSEQPVILFGGSGRFGQEFQYYYPDYLAPPHGEVDITNPQAVTDYICDFSPAQIIHAAAIVGMREAEIDTEHTYRVNVEGTRNIARACLKTGSRLVYVSSVAVFDGEKGLYTEEDIPNPSYYYGWTKLMGEQAVQMLDDYVVVRTDFFKPGIFKYNQALIDHFCSKLPVGQLVERVHTVANSNYRGIINIGNPRDNLYNILKPSHPGITEITLAESTMPTFPRDLSLDISRYNQLFSNRT